jgi:hypothetical protein
MDQLKGLVPSETVADEPSLSPNVSCDTEPSQTHGMLSSWTLTAQSHAIALWLPGSRFSVNIKCSARLEGKFVFNFETRLRTYQSDATVEYLGTGIMERSRHLHKLSCEIPVPRGNQYITVKIRPTLGKGQGQWFHCHGLGFCE